VLELVSAEVDVDARVSSSVEVDAEVLRRIR
jgi:hypothetical protein